MGKVGLVAILLSLCALPAAPGTWYVDGSVPESGDGASWETAFQIIQEGIDAACEGDTVIVAQGTYLENIQFNGKNIVLRSTDPGSATVVQDTVIDGRQGGSVVIFDGTEGDGCALSGFTIRNGQATFGGGINGAGLGGTGTRAAIENNIITSNFASGSGGGVSCCNGIIQNNTISENRAPDSGGLDACDGIIQNNVIACNSALVDGGGLGACGGVVRDNTIVGNSCARAGGGLYLCSGIILNCIIWGNTAPRGPQIHQSSEPSYSCVEDWTEGGTGNITDDPRLADLAAGDYRLSAESPCIDKGLNEDWMWNAVDADGNPRIFQGKSSMTVDMGAYEWMPELPPKPTWYVDASVSVPGDGTSWETAFKTIQEGIDAASDGETVTVALGTYLENIQFKGKNIVLRSTDPQDPAVVAATIIDGNRTGSVVTFDGTENETCVLSGFTIRNGKAENGGAIYGNGTHATIENNVITANSASHYGAGLHKCDGTILNNVIAGNSASYGYGGGGGLAYCHGVMRNNIIVGNSASSGGGLASCGGTIENNTIVNNWAEWSGGGLRGCSGTVRNCIIWGNTGGQLAESSVPTYSCIEGWTGGGEGNIPYCPHLADASAADYHLLSWSPCIDAGDPSSDFSNEPQPNGGRINMGAYGNTPEATSASPDSDGDLLPDAWEEAFLGDLAQGAEDNLDGDPLSNVEEYRLGSHPNLVSRTCYVDGSVAVPGDGTSWDKAFKTVQKGIDAATHGDTVMVAEGIYRENIYLRGRNIVLRSTDPEDPAAVTNTVIEGNQAGSVVTFAGTEGESCILSGFTVRNGRASEGGGIDGNATHAMIENNTITENSATGGGGVSGCDGIIQNNTITGNWAYAFYGGAGGGLYDCNGIIQNNTITGNAVYGMWGEGGGLYQCGGIIQNNTITGNSAIYLGGGLLRCNGTIQNNLIVANSAEDGGGLSDCSGIIQNNTIVNNSATYSGGGLYYCTGTILNCIIWGNTAPEGPQVYNSPGDPLPSITYCCIEGWTGGGVGNISLDPDFVGPDHGDFHLKAFSPCIDAGDPASDFSNEPEPNGGRINMGAYGNTPEATCSFSDMDSDRLADEWEIRWFGDLRYDGASDPDGDRIINATEFRYGWDPCVASGTVAQLGPKGPAFQTIQAAIWEAADLGEIRVYPGIYRENIVIAGKNILVRSARESNDPVAVETIIEGRSTAPVTTFSGTEDERCVITGFVIRNGSVGILGGTGDSPTHATIRNNIIVGNKASGLRFCGGAIENNTIVGNGSGGIGAGLDNCNGTIVNCIIWGNGSGSQLLDSSVPGYSCIEGWSAEGEGNIADDPRFVSPGDGNFRLLPSSPCIDAGENLPWCLFGTDLAGRRRTVYGGKGFYVDIGAYEYYINRAEFNPAWGETTLTWSCWPGTTYSIFFSRDLFTWHLADAHVPSAGIETTSWIDDGTRTGIPPSLVRIRFYRILENP